MRRILDGGFRPGAAPEARVFVHLGGGASVEEGDDWIEDYRKLFPDEPGFHAFLARAEDYSTTLDRDLTPHLRVLARCIRRDEWGSYAESVAGLRQAVERPNPSPPAKDAPRRPQRSRSSPSPLRSLNHAIMKPFGTLDITVQHLDELGADDEKVLEEIRDLGAGQATRSLTAAWKHLLGYTFELIDGEWQRRGEGPDAPHALLTLVADHRSEDVRRLADRIAAVLGLEETRERRWRPRGDSFVVGFATSFDRGVAMLKEQGKPAWTAFHYSVAGYSLPRFSPWFQDLFECLDALKKEMAAG